MSDIKDVQNVHELNVRTNVQKVVRECHLVADTAKDGCPAATFCTFVRTFSSCTF